VGVGWSEVLLDRGSEVGVVKVRKVLETVVGGQAELGK
jgi:hypothetical protein